MAHYVITKSDNSDEKNIKIKFWDDDLSLKKVRNVWHRSCMTMYSY